jgi:hypothetical protein
MMMHDADVEDLQILFEPAVRRDHPGTIERNVG